MTPFWKSPSPCLHPMSTGAATNRSAFWARMQNIATLVRTQGKLHVQGSWPGATPSHLPRIFENCCDHSACKKSTSPSFDIPGNQISVHASAVDNNAAGHQRQESQRRLKPTLFLWQMSPRSTSQAIFAPAAALQQKVPLCVLSPSTLPTSCVNAELPSW